MTVATAVPSNGTDVVRLRNVILADAVLAFAAGCFTVAMSLTMSAMR